MFIQVLTLLNCTTESEREREEEKENEREKVRDIQIS